MTSAVHQNSKAAEMIGKEEIKVNGPKIGARSSANFHKSSASNGMINYASSNHGAGGFG